MGENFVVILNISKAISVLYYFALTNTPNMRNDKWKLK